jgi:hypothetical protein
MHPMQSRVPLSGIPKDGFMNILCGHMGDKFFDTSPVKVHNSTYSGGRILLNYKQLIISKLYMVRITNIFD